MAAKFLLTPLREGRRNGEVRKEAAQCYFYSRPCGRGDAVKQDGAFAGYAISTHAPAGGATVTTKSAHSSLMISTHAPAGGATRTLGLHGAPPEYFYSRPCGRGDALHRRSTSYSNTFLLTPLREGRRKLLRNTCGDVSISTHVPAGGATCAGHAPAHSSLYFYSRPCGRGDSNFPQVRHEVLRQIAER